MYTIILFTNKAGAGPTKHRCLYPSTIEYVTHLENHQLVSVSPMHLAQKWCILELWLL